MSAGDIDSSKLHYCFAQSLIFHNFCSKSSTSSRGWHFPIIGGISRSLAGISRSTPRHFPIIGRHFPVMGFWPFWPFQDFCKLCFRLQVWLAGSPSDWFCSITQRKPSAVKLIMFQFVIITETKLNDTYVDYVDTFQSRSEPLTSTLIEFSQSSRANCKDMDWTLHQNSWSEKWNLQIWIKYCVSTFVCSACPMLCYENSGWNGNVGLNVPSSIRSCRNISKSFRSANCHSAAASWHGTHWF